MVIGGWLTLCAIGFAQGFTRLVIEGKRIVLEYVSYCRSKCIAESDLSSEDHLMCHLCEDAEQDIYAVSTELELVKLETSITLFLTGVESAPKPGQSAQDALDDGFSSAVKRAFDKARETGDCLDIRVHNCRCGQWNKVGASQLSKTII